nr:MAG TPA: hypothetical protein [Caudoviricetes sp.]
MAVSIRLCLTTTSLLIVKILLSFICFAQMRNLKLSAQFLCR